MDIKIKICEDDCPFYFMNDEYKHWCCHPHFKDDYVRLDGKEVKKIPKDCPARSHSVVNLILEEV